MKLYPEMFFSPWHLIVVVMVFIAFIGLVVGKYDRRTILKSTGLSALVIYFIVTIPVGLIVQESSYKEEKIIEALDQEHVEQRANLNYAATDGISLYVGAFEDDDSSEIIVYAGNYGSENFTGSINVMVSDEEFKELLNETYEDIELRPGQKKEIDSFYTTQPMDTYMFTYKTQPE
ncbi:hypothetical protein M3231_06050 [Neobacillus mesonae]|nr:hypothetical protein [Neobacillus mesonae]